MSDQRVVITPTHKRIGFLMRLLSNTLSQQIEQALKPLSLTQAQMAALAQLSLSEDVGLSGAELGRRAGVTAQATSAALANLEGRSLVTRELPTAGGRAQQIRITDSGRVLLNQAFILTEPVDARAQVLLSADEQEQLSTLLARVVTGAGIPLVIPEEPRTS